jgi:hypothetical protein
VASVKALVWLLDLLLRVLLILNGLMLLAVDGPVCGVLIFGFLGATLSI